MQKSKSFKKPIKPNKQLSNNSSKVLLQLSSITVNSKDKSNIGYNFTDRTHNQIREQNNYSVDQNYNLQNKSNNKIINKKQNGMKKNSSLSNKVLNEIMNFSNYLNTRKLSNQNSRNQQKIYQILKPKEREKQIIVLSKQDLKKSKNISQNKNTAKLLLYQSRQNTQKNIKPLSQSKSSVKNKRQYAADSMVCRINLENQDQRNKNSYYPSASTQKRQSFDKRSSFNNSRRSSIYLFQQQPNSGNFDINHIKKSLLAKISNINDQTDPNQSPNSYNQTINPSSFIKTNKRSSQNFTSSQLTATNTNFDQTTPRQKTMMKQQYISKLDELYVVQNDIKKQAPQFIVIWDNLIQAQKVLKKNKKYYPQVKQKYQKLSKQSQQLHKLLFEQNRKFIESKKMIKEGYANLKDRIMQQVQKCHNQVKKKVFKKDLQQIMMFNMKIVLPSSSQMLQSNMSLINSNQTISYSNSNTSQTTLSYSNIPILQLYQQLIKQKSSKKYGMILKKQINNMNMYDSKSMNEYLKKLYQLENQYHKSFRECPSESQGGYFQRVEEIVCKIEEHNYQYEDVKRNYQGIVKNMNQNEQKQNHYELMQSQLLKRMAQHIYQQYKIFQTGNVNISSLNCTNNSNQINQSFTQQQKTIQQFLQLVQTKYLTIYQKYKQLKQKQKLINDSIKSYL